MCPDKFVWISAFSPTASPSFPCSWACWESSQAAHVWGPPAAKLLWSKAISETFCSSSRTMLFNVIEVAKKRHSTVVYPKKMLKMKRESLLQTSPSRLFMRKVSIPYHVMPCALSEHRLIVTPNYNPGLHVISPKITAASPSKDEILEISGTADILSSSLASSCGSRAASRWPAVAAFPSALLRLAIIFGHNPAHTHWPLSVRRLDHLSNRKKNHNSKGLSITPLCLWINERW